MKKIRLSVEFIYSAAKELEISDEEYEMTKEEGISATLPLEISKLKESASYDYFDYKIEDADNNETIVDWDRD